ncbi:MAG: bifunctional DNA-formamidopyrimidine glycosylase/DNA-(apurinic or apyrimidinic site) lyase [Candidatus Limnocylindrus sp.]
MPELPEVETVVLDLARLVSDAKITGAIVYRERNLSTPDAHSFTEAVRGRRILGTRRRAKWIIVELSGGVLLLVHLRMTGQLLVLPAGTATDPYVRISLTLSDGREIRFRDVRAFGRVALVAERVDGEAASSLDPHSPPLLADHGVEPLAAEFTADTLRSLIAHRATRIKSLLLDQRCIVGIGNIYADEALWRAQIHPLTPANKLRAAQLSALHIAIVDVLSEAVAARGSSINDYTAPEGDGEMQERLDVYQRTGEPCHRCGATIQRIVVGGRGTHLCRTCQRAPRGAARSVATPSVRGPRWSERVTPETVGATRSERAAARRRSARQGEAA